MNETLSLLAAMVAGTLLGVFFFAGLWWSLVKGLKASNPGLWFLGSYGSRLTLVVLGFCWISQQDWRRWVMCLLGFQLARVGVMRAA